MNAEAIEDHDAVAGQVERRVIPIKKTIMLQIDYWECNNTAHRHKTKEIAQKCIDNEKNKKLPIDKNTMKRRNINAAKEWVNGSTIKDIAKNIGLSDTQTASIIYKILRISRNPKFCLPNEPENPFLKVGVKPEYRDHYLMRVKAVSDFWCV